jgi:predicted ATPase
MPLFLTYLTRAYAELGQFDDAWRSISDAMTAVETTKERWCEAEVHRVAGEIALKTPEPDAVKAEAYFGHALAVARAQQAKSFELRAAMSMARLWRDQGKRRQAHDLLAPVYNWFTEGLNLPDLKDARALLNVKVEPDKSGQVSFAGPLAGFRACAQKDRNGSLPESLAGSISRPQLRR